MIIPEADRWDIVIISNGVFIAGIELKNTLTRSRTKNVKNWYTKYGKKYELKKGEKQKLSIGTIRKFGDVWFSQEGDPVGQAIIYYLYSRSSSKPKNVLVVEIDDERKDYRISNVTCWVKEVEEIIKQNQKQVIIPKPKEDLRKLIKQEGKYNNLSEIAKKIYECIL